MRCACWRSARSFSYTGLLTVARLTRLRDVLQISKKSVCVLRILARIATWLAASGLCIYLIGYAFDVHKRQTRVAACIWEPVPNPDNMPYEARYCYLTKDTGLLRLYDGEGRQLLAERMYLNLDVPRLYWSPDALSYDTSTGESIQLPPTWLDRLRVLLP